MNHPRPLLTPDALIDMLARILAGPMACPHMTAFGAEARLGHDLGLDSVQMMTLMLHLEDAGIDMAEDTFDRAPDLTIRALAEALSGVAPATEDPVDIKVHCVVSCFCQALKDRGGIDHRPMYLGLWDGQVVVDDLARLSYHSADIDHGFYIHWMQRLFGIAVERWYDPAADKTRNLARLDALIADWQPGTYVMPMIDMFLLPQRQNKFAQDPFPHYALIEPTGDGDIWLMRDPDFRWQGLVPADDLRNAFLRDTVGGGFAFTHAAAHAAASDQIAAMYHATFDAERLPLIEAIEKVIEAHTTSLPRADLEPALRELPVIAIRKYAYEHALALFGDIEGKDHDAFEEACDRIAALHGGLNAVHRRAVAFSRSGSQDEVSGARTQLAELAILERGIKATLSDWFGRWNGART